MTTVATIWVELGLNAKNYHDGLNQAAKSTQGFAKSASGFLGSVASTAMGFLSAQVFTQIGQQVVGFAKDSIDAAGNLNETLNKTKELFGDSSGEIVKWSKNSAQALGLSQGAALDAAAMMAVFGKGAGLAGKDLNDFATDNLGLAADMASFFNTSVEDAALSIQAAFRGEMEPIRKYGVLLDDMSLRNKALELGIVSTTKKALTPQQKVLAANALIWEQTASAQGDFARTSEGYANQQRIFAAQIENAKAMLGEIFLPVLTKVMGWLNTTGIPILQKVIEWVGNMFSAFRETGDLLSGEFLEAATSFLPPEAREMIFSFANSVKEAIGTARVILDFLSQWWTINSPGIIAAAQQVVDSLVTGFQAVREKVEPFIKEVLGKLIAWFLENGPLIQRFAQAIADAFTNYIIPIVVGAVGIILPLLDGVIDIILGLATLIMQVATGDWAGAWETIKAVLTSALAAIWDAIVAAVDLILSFFGTSFAEGVEVWKQNWEQFKQIITTVWGLIVDFVRERVSAVVGAFQNIVGAIKGVIDWVSGLKDAFMNLKLPDWLTPGSPTPFELGLLGIEEAMQNVARRALPQLNANLQLSPVAAGVGMVESRPREFTPGNTGNGGFSDSDLQSLARYIVSATQRGNVN